jgi:hypothetical protein
MVGLHVVLARMKDERFALPRTVVNHFAEKNDVLASIEFTDYAQTK